MRQRQRVFGTADRLRFQHAVLVVLLLLLADLNKAGFGHD